jgi:osmotically inducible protein OsmC
MAATGTAQWHGSIDEGTGTMATGSGIEGTFTKASRFADGTGTNPEELIGAAHAGCFSQFLALLLSEDGTPPTSIETTAKVSIAVTDAGPTITSIGLTSVVDADVPAERIEALGADAKAKCPVSKALSGVADITLKISKA